MDASLYLLTKKAIALPSLTLHKQWRTSTVKKSAVNYPAAIVVKRLCAFAPALKLSSSKANRLLSLRPHVCAVLDEQQLIGETDTVHEACCSDEGKVYGDRVDPFARSASLARGLILLKPTRLLRRFVPRGVMSRPPPFFVVMLTALLYCWMAVKSAIQAKVRSCDCCAGFGITRCDLCEGHQVIWWEGKYKHVEPCPKCFGRRYVRCSKCGGFFGRSIFNHTTQESVDSRKLAKLEKEMKIDESWVGAPKWVT